MSESQLSRDIALRIGLAARELPDTDALRLLKVLADAIGLPPSAEKLAALKVKQLKAAADGEFADVDDGALKAALAVLQGKQSGAELALPVCDAYADGDMPDSIRVACASTQGEEINGHFGSCRYFLIYQLSEHEVRLVDVREADGPSARDDKNAHRAALIGDCQLLFAASIGGPAAAKVVRAGVHPVKQVNGGHARDLLAELQSKLADGPPPWLAKAMGHACEQRIRLQTREAEG